MSNYLRELVEQERQAEQLSHNHARYREVSWFPAYKGMGAVVVVLDPPRIMSANIQLGLEEEERTVNLDKAKVAGDRTRKGSRGLQFKSR